jgi:hypothetical protein
MNSVRNHQSSTGRYRPVWLVLLTFLSLGHLSQKCSAAGQSVEEFLKTKPRWSQLIGTTFRIEGRVATGAGTVLKLHKLPLLFVSEEELPELRGPDLVVEVVGQLRKRETGVLEFELLSLKKTDSDIQRVTRLRGELPRDDPEPWYELGDWAMNRVRFYQSGRGVDQQLSNEATSLYRMAIRKERTSMQEPTYKRLRELAFKSEKYELGAEFKWPLLYEAHYRTWNDVSATASADELATIALRIAMELPEADKPVDEFDAELVDEWRKGPVPYYTKSPELMRPQLHRLLYQEVMFESIGKDADIDGRNGDEIAARLQKYLPEFSKRAESYRQKALDWRVDHATDLPREDVIALRQELVASGQEARADQIIRRWFTPVESRLRRKGAGGLIELAFEYEELFDDSETAVALLLESYRLKPGDSYVAERLEGYGYIRVEGRWRRKDEVQTGEASPIQIAIRTGRVIRGMTSAHVRKAMSRQPDSVTRVLTSREVIEYWVFRAESGSGLSVRMSRPLNRHEGIVRKVFDLPAR